MARILVVEDEPNIVKLISMRLGRQGHEIAVAPDGTSALEAALAQQPDLILLDVMIPAINGFEVLQQLKADPRTQPIPVLMVTARGHERDMAASLDAGAEDYIVKPFSFPDLLARVSSALARRARS